MTGSMGLTREDINTDAITNIASSIANRMMKVNKDMVIGGGVSAASLPVFKKIPYLSRFETRKIVFEFDKNSKIDYKSGINKALEFEMLLLDNKQQKYDEDTSRILMIKRARIPS